jgi:membrane protein required for colicin V production
MTWVDLVVLGVLAVSALLAFMRGLVREVLGLGAWVGAILAASWALPLARPQFHQWLGSAPWVDPATWGVLFLITLIILMVISHWISRLVRASPLGGLDRTLGLVFGLVRGAALLVIAYIGAGMVVPVDRWPEAVKQARALPIAVEGAIWVAEKVPAGYRPQVYPAPTGRATSAEALLHATPQGRAVGKQPDHE